MPPEISWSLSALVDRVRQRLAQPLPGLEAQRLMAPLPRVGWRPAEIPANARNAAALLLLYGASHEADHEAHLALTVRAEHLPHHGGQVSLPGGAVEPGERIEDAALRETAEELGIDTAGVRILGRLTALHIPVSGFVLHPVVAAVTARPTFAPDAREVARVVEARVVDLGDPLAVRLRVRRHEGRDYEVPYFLVGGEVVWGATAMVLSEFLTLLGRAPFRPPAPTENDDA